ncbi:MAG: endonuclease/exonuclease/phosphatase family protein [Verrucomicrobiales bacterium]|nr:endonuclease/exonuclease/phosphatase family protein [Verrucomicrobiales bacterium]
MSSLLRWASSHAHPPARAQAEQPHRIRPSHAGTIRIAWMIPLLCLVTAMTHAAEPELESVRVMTFNLWHGGDAGRQPLEQSAAVIRAAKADLVGLQETEGITPSNAARPNRAPELAQLLGWHCFDQGGRTAILSRHPFAQASPNQWGTSVQLPSGTRIWIFNAHFPASPYQPYQLLRIPYFDAPFLRTADEAVKAAHSARGASLDRLTKDMAEALASNATVFVTGDFNEPSHLDWTEATVKAGHCPLRVPWPTTSRVTNLGLIDGYRAAWPDPVARRGLTWTPLTREDDPQDRHDRIDFVFMRGATVRAGGAHVLGEDAAKADVVITPYPSDHRAVVVEAWLPKPGAQTPR